MGNNTNNTHHSGKPQQHNVVSSSPSPSTTTTNGNNNNNSSNNDNIKPLPSSFEKIPVSRPVSSLLSDMQYRCHIVELLKDFLTNDKSLVKHNLDFIDNLKDVIHRISNTIGMKQNKNDVFKSGGLKIICLLFNQLASFTFDDNLTRESVKQPLWKGLEEIISDITYILYKMAEHAKARTVMISTGIIYSMWSVAQRFNTILEMFFTEKPNETTDRPISRFYRLRTEANQQIESAIYHMNEIIELLSAELSLATDLTDLFKSANRHLFSGSEDTGSIGSIGGSANSSEDLDGFGLQSCDVFLGVVDLPLSEWSQSNFDLFLNESNNLNLSLSDFDLNLHSVVINCRTNGDFLEKFFVKWNIAGDGDKDSTSTTTNCNRGFYLLKRDQGISKFVLQKFCQLLYTDSLVFTQEDVQYMKSDWDNELNKKKQAGEDVSNMIFSVDTKFGNEGIKILLSNLKNSCTRNGIERLLNLGEYQVVSNTDTSLFDEFDEKLVKQEFEFFFKQNDVDSRDSVSFFHHKKDQIKDNARQTGGLEEDFSAVFNSITRVTTREEEQQQDGGASSSVVVDFDVLLGTEGNELGQVDMEVMGDEKYATQSSLLIGAQERGGLSCHRCILSARSEYMRKVFKYETSPKCLAKCEDLKSWNSNSEMELFNTQVKTIQIPNLSYSTLSLILRFIYCGENILKIDAKSEESEQTIDSNYQLIPQTYVECLIASDLFLLYPLKKFCEQQIMTQLDDMKEVDPEFAMMLLNIALTYNCGDLFKEKCSSYLKE